MTIKLEYLIDLTQKLWASEPVDIAAGNYVFVSVTTKVVTGAWDDNSEGDDTTLQHQVSNGDTGWAAMAAATDITDEGIQEDIELSPGAQLHRLQLTVPNGTTTTNARARVIITYRQRPFA